jgi:hypothetical protein
VPADDASPCSSGARGTVVRLNDATPQLTPRDDLRLNEGSLGTEEAWAEGDCGACTVGTAPPRRRPPRLCPVKASCWPARPDAQARVDLHGSQCAYRTLDFVMSLFALFSAPGRRAASATRSTTRLPGTGAATPAVGRSSMPALRPVRALRKDRFAEHEPETAGQAGGLGNDLQTSRDGINCAHVMPETLAIETGGEVSRQIDVMENVATGNLEGINRTYGFNASRLAASTRTSNKLAM